LHPEKVDLMFSKKIKFLICDYDMDNMYGKYDVSLATEDGEV